MAGLPAQIINTSEKILKDLEQKKTDIVLDGWEAKNKERHDSIVQNILNFEEKKDKILKDAKKINTEDFLKSKGIEKEE